MASSRPAPIPVGDEDEIRLAGPCCACLQDVPRLRNIVALPFRNPNFDGRGWGCVVCHLPPNGAMAVVCDPCMEAERAIVHACVSYPTEPGRLIVAEDLKEPWAHDLSQHPPRSCRVCGCTDDRACPGGCAWVAEDLCSACEDFELDRARRISAEDLGWEMDGEESDWV